MSVFVVGTGNLDPDELNLSAAGINNPPPPSQEKVDLQTTANAHGALGSMKAAGATKDYFTATAKIESGDLKGGAQDGLASVGKTAGATSEYIKMRDDNAKAEEVQPTPLRNPPDGPPMGNV